MRHPAEGLLRRLLDEPDGVAAADREHVDGCPECRERMDRSAGDAARVASALDFDVVPDVDVAWDRLAASLRDAPAPARKRRRPRTPVIAIAGVTALLTGATAAAAGNWLPVFHTERVAPVTVPQADLVHLPELDELGVMRVENRPDPRNVPDARTAREVTGLPTATVGDLPRGVSGQPRFLVADRITGVFRFDRARAEQALGGPVPEPPPGLADSEFRLTAGPAAATVWPGGTGAPALVVGRVVAPRAFSTGVPFATARDYLLTLPGLPASIAGQLDAFTEGTTLPLLVRAGTETTSTAEVNGVPAVVKSSADGAFSAVFWVRDGHVNAVGGSLSAAEVLRVAEQARWVR
ncbi:hypothetical protein [Actinoplanes sp. G11-F43]|uniref:hypothetical protein n=1 Tax=Actinoplanes sp. G11-F43 TaxID=3424130 RepID=UPI003D32E052